jgi:hypothetical protein
MQRRSGTLVAITRISRCGLLRKPSLPSPLGVQRLGLYLSLPLACCFGQVFPQPAREKK